MVTVSSALFAINGTVSKLILHTGLDAPRLTALRSTGAFLGLMLLVLCARPGVSRLRVAPRELPLLVGYGLAGFFLVPMLYFVGIDRLPVGVALLFEYTAPLLVALWARFGARQRVRRRLWLGLAASLLGLAGVAELWQIRRPGPGALNPVGVAAAFTAAGLLAVYYILGARGVARRDTLSLTWWAFGTSALAGSLVRPWWSFPYRILGTQSGGVPVWLLTLYLVCCGSIASYLLIAAALRHLPPTSVGIIGMLEPVIASGVAWVVLHERLHPAQLAGGVLILAGVALAETARVAPPRPGPESAAPLDLPVGAGAGPPPPAPARGGGDGG
jgi:drug/metabolite transporter (DMT)-like permease